MLSPDQIKARAGKLTASRVACLMTGDAAKIMQLYLEFIGDAVPEDLSDVWAVQLGTVTEALQLDWYERKGSLVTRRGEVVVHPTLRWAAATLDGWDETLRCPVECKHVGGREPLEVIIDRYQPQMQWQMVVTGAEQCGLSVIMGANEPIVEYIEADDDYAGEMIERAVAFMECVQRRRPPVALDPIAAPIDASKVYDFAGNNSWAASAADWLANKAGAELCKDAEKVLKSIVPADAKKCHGHGVQVTRDRAGRLSLREATS
jgi:predicted phage-related endonuclease